MWATLMLLRGGVYDALILGAGLATVIVLLQLLAVASASTVQLFEHGLVVTGGGSRARSVGYDQLAAVEESYSGAELRLRAGESIHLNPAIERYDACISFVRLAMETGVAQEVGSSRDRVAAVTYTPRLGAAFVARLARYLSSPRPWIAPGLLAAVAFSINVVSGGALDAVVAALSIAVFVVLLDATVLPLSQPRVEMRAEGVAIIGVKDDRFLANDAIASVRRLASGAILVEVHEGAPLVVEPHYHALDELAEALTARVGD